MNHWWLKCAFDVTGHQNVNTAVIIVPIDGKAAVPSAGPVFMTDDKVQFLELSHVSVSILLSGILDAKIVND